MSADDGAPVSVLDTRSRAFSTIPTPPGCSFADIHRATLLWSCSTLPIAAWPSGLTYEIATQRVASLPPLGPGSSADEARYATIGHRFARISVSGYHYSDESYYVDRATGRQFYESVRFGRIRDLDAPTLTRRLCRGYSEALGRGRDRPAARRAGGRGRLERGHDAGRQPRGRARSAARRLRRPCRAAPLRRARPNAPGLPDHRSSQDTGARRPDRRVDGAAPCLAGTRFAWSSHWLRSGHIHQDAPGRPKRCALCSSIITSASQSPVGRSASGARPPAARRAVAAPDDRSTAVACAAMRCLPAGAPAILDDDLLIEGDNLAAMAALPDGVVRHGLPRSAVQHGPRAAPRRAALRRRVRRLRRASSHRGWSARASCWRRTGRSTCTSTTARRTARRSCSTSCSGPNASSTS